MVLMLFNVFPPKAKDKGCERMAFEAVGAPRRSVLDARLAEMATPLYKVYKLLEFQIVVVCGLVARRPVRYLVACRPVHGRLVARRPVHMFRHTSDCQAHA